MALNPFECFATSLWALREWRRVSTSVTPVGTAESTFGIAVTCVRLLLRLRRCC